ncbi:MAG: hypothetical protein K2M16_01695 [Muribaculaceae bacterium]|nr:hypothetical protein [Muribaculaceae bacterium]
MKKLLSACILGAAVFSAAAAESTVTYTYAGDEIGAWGKGKSEIYDVAIRINDPALVGKKITSIRALVTAYEGIESTSVWLSKELTLEKIDGVKVTVPDTYSAAVTPDPVSLPGIDDQVGQLAATLDTPYVLTEGGIYVGYSLTVPSVPKGESLTGVQDKPILLSPSNNPESLYIRASKDFLKWLPYNDKLGGAAVIYVTLEGEFAEYSLGIKDIPATYAGLNEDFAVKAVVSNIGSSPVSSIGYSYTIGGRTYGNVVDLESPIQPDLVNTSVVTLPISALDELGSYDLELKITTVNGVENVSAAAVAYSQVNVLPFVPVHRPMLEEFTGTWCGWCTRGYYALEALNEIYGDAVVLAAYHNGDPMEVTATFPVNATGFPSATLNRNGIEDPFLGNSNDGFGMRSEVEASMETMVPASIEVSAKWANAEKTAITVNANSTFFETKADAGYKIGYLLINNGLTGTGSDWLQSNYYSSYAGQYDGTELEILTTWPSKVPGLIFNDVVVDVTGMMGVAGSVPSEITYNTPYISEFSFDIEGNSVIQDKDKLYVAAFIINPDGTILNSSKAKVSDSTAVNVLEPGMAEVSAEYYTISGARVAAPQNGIFVKVSRMADGSVRTSKVIR